MSFDDASEDASWWSGACSRRRTRFLPSAMQQERGGVLTPAERLVADRVAGATAACKAILSLCKAARGHTLRAALLLFLTVGSITTHAALPGSIPETGPLPSLAPMLEKVNPAVVNIGIITTVQDRNPLLGDPFFRRFFNLPEARRYRRAQAAGSGVVVDAERGYIITNNHVVERADEITVGLADGRSLEAKLVGRDPQVDLAVLQVPPNQLTEITFADSAALRVGDFVVAIGNPFGLNQTVTSGIVSALGRSGLRMDGYEDFIQTDAPINPGNSGGALVDLRGRLTGINTAILAPNGGNVGIGFAIPSNMVSAVMQQIIDNGEVRRGYLGVVVQGLNPDLAKAFAVNLNEGVVVVDVEPDSVADRAGVMPGDVVIRFGDRAIRKASDFDSQAAVTFVGDEVDVLVLRDSGEEKLTLKVAGDNQEKIRGRRVDRRLAGLELQNFRNADEPNMSAGVLITDVDDDSAAWHYGLRPGDIIVAANRQGVRDLDDLREVARVDSRQILLRVYRAGRFGYFALR